MKQELKARGGMHILTTRENSVLRIETLEIGGRIVLASGAPPGPLADLTPPSTGSPIEIVAKLEGSAIDIGTELEDSPLRLASGAPLTPLADTAGSPIKIVAKLQGSAIDIGTELGDSPIGLETLGEDSEVRLDTHGLRGKIALASVGDDSSMELTTTGARADIRAHASGTDSEARFAGAAGTHITSGPGSPIKIQGGDASSKVWLQRGGNKADPLRTPLSAGGVVRLDPEEVEFVDRTPGAFTAADGMRLATALGNAYLSAPVVVINGSSIAGGAGTSTPRAICVHQIRSRKL